MVLPRSHDVTAASETLTVAGLDAGSAASGTLFGGMTFGWMGEGGSLTVTDPTLAKVQFTLRKMAILSKASNELNDDAPIGQQIEEAMTRGAPFALDYSLLNRTGAGCPRGVLQDAALVVVSKETDQDADSIVYENVCNMCLPVAPVVRFQCDIVRPVASNPATLGVVGFHRDGRTGRAGVAECQRQVHAVDTAGHVHGLVAGPRQPGRFAVDRPKPVRRGGCAKD